MGRKRKDITLGAFDTGSLKVTRGEIRYEVDGMVFVSQTDAKRFARIRGRRKITARLLRNSSVYTTIGLGRNSRSMAEVVSETELAGVSSVINSREYIYNKNFEDGEKFGAVNFGDLRYYYIFADGNITLIDYERID